VEVEGRPKKEKTVWSQEVDLQGRGREQIAPKEKKAGPGVAWPRLPACRKYEVITTSVGGGKPRSRRDNLSEGRMNAGKVSRLNTKDRP